MSIEPGEFQNVITLGSWVSPQLLVVLNYIDTNFIKKLKIQLVKTVDLYLDNKKEGIVNKETEKLLGAMLYFIEKQSQDETYIENKEYKYLISLEDYNGYLLSKNWEENLLKLMKLNWNLTNI